MQASRVVLTRHGPGPRSAVCSSSSLLGASEAGRVRVCRATPRRGEPRREAGHWPHARVIARRAPLGLAAGAVSGELVQRARGRHRRPVDGLLQILLLAVLPLLCHLHLRIVLCVPRLFRLPARVKCISEERRGKG